MNDWNYKAIEIRSQQSEDLFRGPKVISSADVIEVSLNNE